MLGVGRRRTCCPTDGDIVLPLPARSFVKCGKLLSEIEMKWFFAKGRSRLLDQVNIPKAYLGIELIVSILLVADGSEVSRDELVEKVIALKKAVPFEMRHYNDQVLSTDEEIRSAVNELVKDGVYEEWIEFGALRSSDYMRRSLPFSTREKLNEPARRDTLTKILVHVSPGVLDLARAAG
jgi:hypothetical protein